MKISKQFIGDTMWIALSCIAIMHSLAFFIRDTGFELPVFILFGILTLIITWRSQLSGLLIAFTEIFVGGHGHLLDINLFGFSFSLRMLIFAIVMSIWIVRFIQTRSLKIIWVRDLPWLILVIAVSIGSLIGFLQNDFLAVFDDMNSYVVIGYLLPIISIKWNQKKKRRLLQVLFASTIWIIGFTILLAYAFTHIDGDNLHNLYTFVRDSRLAEVTLQVVGVENNILDSTLIFADLAQNGDYWYRIFMPAQTVVITGVLIAYSAMIYLWRREKLPWFAIILFTLSILTIFLSLSRSYILGLIAGGLILFFSAWMFGKTRFKILSRTILGFILSIASILVIVGIVFFPIPTRPDLSEAAFFQTSADTSRSEAVVSRWNLLNPMMDEIGEHPILGSGFGEEVSYISEDPRIQAQENGGVYTTYRFEWGWHDVWLKMGLLGLLGFGWYIVSLLRVGWFTMQSKGYKWLIAGLIASIVSLFVIHTFSPYLNHPIGLVLMLFVIPFVDWERFDKKKKLLSVEIQKKRFIKQQTIAVTSNIK